MQVAGGIEGANEAVPRKRNSHEGAAMHEDGDPLTMTYVMLVGTDVALLEGLAQTLAGLGHRPAVTTSLAEAREIAAPLPPLVLVADRALASSAGGELLSVPIAAGGARLLYRAAATPPAPLLPALQRAVLADLTLPLERHRLAALVQSIGARAKTTGKAPRHTPPETRSEA
jgi:DNA-binding NtrC family response regulator